MSKGPSPSLAELDALYREVDEAFSGHGCPASTECCRFGITGREPYVTSVEVAALRVAVAHRGGPRAVASARKGRLALAEDERACPLLDKSGRCSAYAARPFGCRTFYCDRAERNGRVRQTAINDFVRRLKGIAARHEPGGDAGRPLTRALGELG